MKKRIVCYFINYNDSFYIPFLAKHYFRFCEKIVMYDQHSTDGSRELAISLGMEVRTFGTAHELNDQHYLAVKNHCWKECRGKGIDYVIVIDADEFICIDNLEGSAPVVEGFNMIADHLPERDILEIKTGAPSIHYCKQAIFSPDNIQEIDYVHGCHRNRIKGFVTRTGKCRLLHYRMIGGVDRIIERHAVYRSRMGEFNMKHKMGIHYMNNDDSKREEWQQLQSISSILF